MIHHLSTAEIGRSDSRRSLHKKESLFTHNHTKRSTNCRMITIARDTDMIRKYFDLSLGTVWIAILHCQQVATIDADMYRRGDLDLFAQILHRNWMVFVWLFMPFFLFLARSFFILSFYTRPARCSIHQKTLFLLGRKAMTQWSTLCADGNLCRLEHWGPINNFIIEEWLCLDCSLDRVR